MGTPAIAAAALRALLEAGHEVVAVYTRPDKPVGRKQQLSPPPVKLLAAENRIPVFQPKSLRGGEEAERLLGLAPQLIAVVAYGLLLPKDVLALPEYGCINLHVSLLPKLRGAAPIQWAVINGLSETGVSIMQMDEGLDTGDVLAEEKLAIGPNQTAGELMEEAAVLGGRLLIKTVADIGAGRSRPRPQQGEASLAPQLNKTMARLDFTRPARQLHNVTRGCNPWPLAWFVSGGKKIQVLRTKPITASGAPGEVVGQKPLRVCCGEGALELLEVRPEGKNAMSGEQWARGRRLAAGDTILDN